MSAVHSRGKEAAGFTEQTRELQSLIRWVGGGTAARWLHSEAPLRNLSAALHRQFVTGEASTR